MKLRKQALKEIEKQSKIIQDMLINMCGVIEGIKYKVNNNDELKDDAELKTWFKRFSFHERDSVDNESPYSSQVTDATREIDKWVEALLELEEEKEK